VLEKVHAAIREDPTAGAKEEWSGDRAKYKRQIKVRKSKGGREGGKGSVETALIE